MGSTPVVGALELDAGDVLDDVDQLVGGARLPRAGIDWVAQNPWGGDFGGLGPIVDLHERTGLVAVTTDPDVVRPGELGGDDLAAGPRSKGQLFDQTVEVPGYRRKAAILALRLATPGCAPG